VEGLTWERNSEVGPEIIRTTVADASLDPDEVGWNDVSLVSHRSPSRDSIESRRRAGAANWVQFLTQVVMRSREREVAAHPICVKGAL
jgi:hypothetical protein